ncbi:NAD(P)-dependent oxidoreductase [Pimelobacter sp. 30-1]|uniref:NAD(P)-dependent oxidoreductase n=1 Tax=Pimelobacter sp. 30-1 TaxID=2004991 RepID=UPI0027E33DD9|nr:NAD(P)-dependent oxidoreductase [Pimelobacter sp. 30-1]
MSSVHDPGTVGFLGLGSMGSAMAGRLVAARHRVRVWNRSPAAGVRLAEQGAELAADAALALQAPVSFSMLADDEAAQAVLSPAALDGPAGRLHVSMASLSPRASRELGRRCADAGMDYLAAPVLGRPAVAASGGLNILVGGRNEALERARPLLETIGARVWPISERPEVANVVKIAVNLQIIHALQALAESIALVEAHEVAPDLFAELLGATLFGGVVHRTYGQLIAERAYRPAGFTVPLGAKDLRLAAEVAEDGGVVLPSLPALQGVFAAALERPGAESLDWAAIAEVTRHPELPAPERRTITELEEN